MLILSFRTQLVIALLLAVLMILTRSYHFASSHQLADAAWAVFFLAGVYLRSIWPLLGFFALGGWLDFSAFAWGGIDDFCFTPAYIFLLPAYASLWMAGKWFAKQYQFNWRSLIPLTISSAVGLTACELFSNGGFYLFSGYFSAVNGNEFIDLVIKYFPLYIETFGFYVGFAAVIHIFFTYLAQALSLRSAVTK
ncbi:hypothetical protein ABF87_11525 [Nitrosomonas sp. JL21]|uniref:hypothetical protein n=1 Tax=Nitrosomonas sp. JL21 TaxID=153949 RepID=UPI00136C3DF2|nr:hypothetical protein [Nitrosomonas sp. JL21]MBL8497499.1 hypothetical protein [Nitrosomonas sp.]MXS78573.1 hypothetical protein [Nitrosomonas sp. JL21]